jgi:spore maturation protein SpmB
MVLNASGLTIIPVSILAFRATAGSSSPAEVFLPILISTFFATLAALIYVGIKQKINLLNKVILLYVGTLTVLICALMFYLSSHPEMVQPISLVGSNLILFSFIGVFFILAIRSKVNVFESFIEGAKGGFEVALNIIPYLVAMLAAIAVFRTCGAMELLLKGIKFSLEYLGMVHTEFIDALPVAFMKPFSGSGARALMVDTFTSHGVDSFVAKLAATFQGSTETTFYVLAVYFGSIRVKNTRYAAMGGIIADIIGASTAIIVAYLFYKIK